MRVGCFRALYGAEELSYAEVSKVRFRGEHTVFPFIPEDKFARKNPVISLGRSFRLSRLSLSISEGLHLFFCPSISPIIHPSNYLPIYLSM